MHAPALLQLAGLHFIQRRNVALQFTEPISDQNQPLMLWTTFQAQDTLHSPAIGRVASQAEDRFSRVSDDAAGFQEMLQAP